MSLNSSPTIIFTFRLIFWGKVWTLLFFKILPRLSFYKDGFGVKVDMPLKRNQTKPTLPIILLKSNHEELSRIISYFLSFSISCEEGCLCGVMVKAMDCEIVVGEFRLQSSYCIHFQINTLGKGINPLILLAMG